MYSPSFILKIQAFTILLTEGCFPYSDELLVQVQGSSYGVIFSLPPKFHHYLPVSIVANRFIFWILKFIFSQPISTFCCWLTQINKLVVKSARKQKSAVFSAPSHPNQKILAISSSIITKLASLFCSTLRGDFEHFSSIRNWISPYNISRNGKMYYSEEKMKDINVDFEFEWWTCNVQGLL